VSRLAALALLAAAAWAEVASAQPAAPPSWVQMDVQAYEAPKPAPAFALSALDGRLVRLEEQRGRALLLFFWATW
jgi:hypothetical protein